jgi:hypothetical protein
MKHIEATSNDGCYIKVSDDETGKDIGIYCNNVDQTNDFIIKLAVELLKGE